MSHTQKEAVKILFRPHATKLKGINSFNETRGVFDGI